MANGRQLSLCRCVLGWNECSGDDFLEQGGYMIHRLVYSLFPGRGNRPLYHAEPARDGGCVVLALCGGKPSPDRAMAIVPCRIEARTVGEPFFGYPHYAFGATLCPAKREQGSGKLVFLQERGEIGEWFLKRAPGWGFEVDPADLRFGGTCTDRFPHGDKGDGDILIRKTGFSGILRVTDRDLFARAFRNGLGRCKAFGCGLLRLSPIPDIRAFRARSGRNPF